MVGIVKYKDEILVLKRNSKRKSSPGKWQTVSGFMKEFEAAEETVLREVKEETDLEGRIERSGEVFEVTDEWRRWVIIPYLVSVDSKEIEIDPEEHSEYRWIKPEDIEEYDIVKGVRSDLKSVGLLQKFLSS